MGHHHHNHHFEPAESLRGVYVLAIALNLLFVFAEAGLGWSCNSLGLLSDAGHNLSDVFSLLLALFALELAKVRPARNYTYGYKKGTVLISLLNAIILLVAVGAIIVESIHKFSNPAPVNGAVVSWTAGAGIIVNGVSAWLLMRKRKSDLNAEGAFLHMAADTLVSIGVVVSGIAMSFTGWYIIDPVISLVIVGCENNDYGSLFHSFQLEFSVEIGNGRFLPDSHFHIGYRPVCFIVNDNTSHRRGLYRCRHKEKQCH